MSSEKMCFYPRTWNNSDMVKQELRVTICEFQVSS